jgi:hypothetical protein
MGQYKEIFNRAARSAIRFCVGVPETAQRDLDSMEQIAFAIRALLLLSIGAVGGHAIYECKGEWSGVEWVYSPYVIEIRLELDYLDTNIFPSRYGAEASIDMLPRKLAELSAKFVLGVLTSQAF